VIYKDHSELQENSINYKKPEKLDVGHMDLTYILKNQKKKQLSMEDYLKNILKMKITKITLFTLKKLHIIVK
jgi:coproporphyrinogen III oxidase-like Fe-S oxidoreductase